MELGNILFGNSRGNYPVPWNWEDMFYNLVKKVYMKVYPEDAEKIKYGVIDYHVTDYENDTFKITPYWWGSCTCGWDEIDNSHEKARNLKHRDSCYRNEWKQIPNELKLTTTNRKKLLNILEPLYKKHGWDTTEKNWWYGCATRCSCDYGERYNKILDEYAKEFGYRGHKPTCKLVEDNFVYKPTGFAIQWYKYPLRDSYMNQEITRLEFYEIIKNCMKSIDVG